MRIGGVRVPIGRGASGIVPSSFSSLAEDEDEEEEEAVVVLVGVTWLAVPLV
jgi:hypothetical protein